jgi:SAM-dependent methyltransferase
MRKLLRKLTPPGIWRVLAIFKSRITGAPWCPWGVEQPPEFYDRDFHRYPIWKEHYSASHYYPLWTVVAERVRRLGARQVLDIGCGPGQVAALLRDTGLGHYLGLDFSPARVEQARTVCPEFEFQAADVFVSNLLETAPYDLVLMMEFLEHVEQDLHVLRRIRPGTPVLGTVPNFPAQAHVRHFSSAAEVLARYGDVLGGLVVTPFLADDKGTTYFILQAIR